MNQKRIFSLISVLVLLLSICPVQAFAQSTPDGTPPVLKRVMLSESTVDTPATIEMTIDAADDVSGPHEAWVTLICEETGEYLHCSLYSTHYDVSVGGYAPYEDGQLHGKLQLPVNALPGDYVVYRVTLDDAAGNRVIYERSAAEGSFEPLPLPGVVKALTLQVRSENADSEPPVPQKITLSASSVVPGGTVEVVVDTTDDISGAVGGRIELRCAETEQSFNCNLQNKYYDAESGKNVTSTDGKLYGTLKIDTHEAAGTFELDLLYLVDEAENGIIYRVDPVPASSEIPFPENVEMVRLEVLENPQADLTPPVLNSITLSKNTVITPDTIEITMDATDDNSGAKGAGIYFLCPETNKELICYVSSTYYDDATGKYQEYADGKLHGTLNIDQYVEPGIFHVRYILLSDNAKNQQIYHSEVFDDPTLPLPGSVAALRFEVLTGDQIEHEFSVGDPTHDGEISAKDATMILRHSVGLVTENVPFCADCADFTGDGEVTAKDATMVLRHSVGLLN